MGPRRPMVSMACQVHLLATAMQHGTAFITAASRWQMEESAGHSAWPLESGPADDRHLQNACWPPHKCMTAEAHRLSPPASPSMSGAGCPEKAEPAAGRALMGHWRATLLSRQARAAVPNGHSILAMPSWFYSHGDSACSMAMLSSTNCLSMSRYAFQSVLLLNSLQPDNLADGVWAAGGQTGTPAGGDDSTVWPLSDG